jgi:hypothetical protein
MKLTIWDVLAILLVVAAVTVAAVVFAILADPESSLNPFPPPTLPATIMVPTSTSTQVSLPPTWTPTPRLEPTQRPTSTQYPTSTELVLPAQ